MTGPLAALTNPGATLGVMTSASLAVAMIGQALAQARGLVTKHAVKQVDRLLSNQKVDVWESFAHWVPHLVGPRREIIVAMDWWRRRMGRGNAMGLVATFAITCARDPA
jgi:hypothetical protein